jgi:hypothetical protein
MSPNIAAIHTEDIPLRILAPIRHRRGLEEIGNDQPSSSCSIPFTRTNANWADVFAV